MTLELASLVEQEFIFTGLLNLIGAVICTLIVTRDLKKGKILLFPMMINLGVLGFQTNIYLLFFTGAVCATSIFDVDTIKNIIGRVRL